MSEKKVKHTVRMDYATVQALRGASFGMGLPQGAVLQTIFNGDKRKAFEFMQAMRERTEEILETYNGKQK
jgi:hypothetical protein